MNDFRTDEGMIVAESTPSTRLRRNGKQSSCEPCRRAKLSCDHLQPCGRCTRRNRTQNCVYHPAPMARKNMSSIRESSESGRHVPPLSTKPVASTRQSSLQAVNPFSLKTAGSFAGSRTLPTLSLGYMGATGHSAILLENKADLQADVLNDVDEASLNNLPKPGPDTVKRQAFCSAVLNWLPNRSACEHLVDFHYNSIGISVSIRPIMRHFTSEFWSRYGSRLKEPRTPEDISWIGDELCRNTSVALPVPTSNHGWLDSFSGPRSRWDMVGILFVTLAMSCVTMPGNDIVLNQLVPANTDRRGFVCSLMECAEACLMLCEELDIQSNVLVVTLLLKCTMMQTVLEGDTSHAVWKRLGSVVNAVTAFGLHREVSSTISAPLLYVEHRKRVLCSAFGLDKLLACFLGRPPALSRRYLSTQLPLDVRDEELLTDDVLQLYESLDDNGWNKQGNIYPVTLVRAFMLWAIIRDEVLELSLGPPASDISLRICDVRQRLETIYTEMPVAIRSSINKSMFASMPGWQISGITQVQLQRLQDHFLLERIEHQEQDEQRYLDVAKQMLRIVIALWNERDRYVEHKDSIHWQISCYGIPSASALSIDLWKRSTSPQSYPPLCQRSDIIQNLSLFIACLDWIEPTDGNYVLCSRVRKMIKHILDHVLAPDFIPAEAPSEIVSGFDLADITLADLPTFGTDLQDWFDMADWVPEA